MEDTRAAHLNRRGLQPTSALLTTFTGGTGAPSAAPTSSITSRSSTDRAWAAARGGGGVPPPQPRSCRAPLHHRVTERAVVVADTVFSMDGDVADVDALAELCAGRGALLVLDEARHTAPIQPHRAGSSARSRSTVGGLGRVVAGPGPSHRADGPLRVHKHPLPRRHRRRPRRSRRHPLPRGQPAHNTCTRQRRAAASGHPSPVVPVVFGDEGDQAAAAALLDQGMLGPPPSALRPCRPAPPRLRVPLSAARPRRRSTRWPRRSPTCDGHVPAAPRLRRRHRDAVGKMWMAAAVPGAPPPPRSAAVACPAVEAR